MTVYILSWVLVYLIIGLGLTLVAFWFDDEDDLEAGEIPTAVLLWPLVLAYTVYLIFTKITRGGNDG